MFPYLTQVTNLDLKLLWKNYWYTVFQTNPAYQIIGLQCEFCLLIQRT